MKFKVFFSTVFCLAGIMVYSQHYAGWQHLDPETDSTLGISTYRAFEYLKNKIPGKEVIVAVIDNGADISHSDLQGQIWVNKGEIAGNGIDDDKNGYIDDINGWNFLGNAKGENIKRETIELTRLYRKYSTEFKDKDTLKLRETEITDFEKYRKVKAVYLKNVKDKKEEIKFYEMLVDAAKISDKRLKSYLKKDSYSIDDLKLINDTASLIGKTAIFMEGLLKDGYTIQKLESILNNNRQDLETRLNPEFNPRKSIIGDNPDEMKYTGYGNNQVNAQGPAHGTGVASIIGALNNDFGIDGVARKVKLMIIRILPNGDEYDKDVALAILYAIKNKAEIINCSFGKLWSANPEFVEIAMKEAEKNGVLIVHAAGNDGFNNDSINTYPTGVYSNGKRAGNWLNVGASTQKDNEKLVAWFSNYGRKTVDVFAPGYEIYNAILGNSYASEGGTSIAAPVVAGMAAVLKSYFPALTAEQIKKIIIKSAYIPSTKEIMVRKTKLKFAEMSVSGGIANLYRAVLFAEQEN
ncbi:MAG: S8 family serine peptidase [Bacteroidales bacterium]